MYTLAHITDWHTTTLRGVHPGALLGKRFFGWLSWNLRRARRHRPEVLECLFEDLRNQAPDHVVITGDLTNVSLESEFVEAATALARLGSADWISLIPGNHDAYVPMSPERSWDHWAPYMTGDDASFATRAPRFGEFPTVRVRGKVAIVGLCSALPTPLFQASGRLGDAQLERVETILGQLRQQGLFRVVLVHHPVLNEDLSPRRRLQDSQQLQETLARCGAELVLHGHRHRTIQETTPGPAGPIPVVGGRSSSYVGEHEGKRAQYHLYEFDPGDPGASIKQRVRGWDAASQSFVAEGDVAL